MINEKNRILLLVYYLLIGLIFSHDADHLILSRITITPTEAEMVSIYNPTSEPIDLSDYYILYLDKIKNQSQPLYTNQNIDYLDM